MPFSIVETTAIVLSADMCEALAPPSPWRIELTGTSLDPLQAVNTEALSNIISLIILIRLFNAFFFYSMLFSIFVYLLITYC